MGIKAICTPFMLLLFPPHTSCTKKWLEVQERKPDLTTQEAQKWKPQRWSIASTIAASITLCSIELPARYCDLATDSKCLKKGPDQTHNKWDETRKRRRRRRTRENYTKISWRCTTSPVWEDPPSSREDRQVKISSKKTQCRGKNPQFVTRLYVLDAAGPVKHCCCQPHTPAERTCISAVGILICVTTICRFRSTQLMRPC